MEELYKLDAGYKCLSRETINQLLAKKKDYFMGRTKVAAEDEPMV